MTVSEELLYENAPKARDLWLSTLPQKAEVPEHTFSEQFEKKMGRLLRRPHMIYERSYHEKNIVFNYGVVY